MPKTLEQMFAAADATKTCAPGTCLHECAEWWLDRASGEADAYLDEQSTPRQQWLAAVADGNYAHQAELGMLAHWRHTPTASARHGMASGHPGHISPVRRIDANGVVWVHSTDMALVKGRGVYKPGSCATVPLNDVTVQMALIFDGFSRQIAGVVVVPEPAPKPVPVAAAKPTPDKEQNHPNVDAMRTGAKKALAHNAPDSRIGKAATRVLRALRGL